MRDLFRNGHTSKISFAALPAGWYPNAVHQSPLQYISPPRSDHYERLFGRDRSKGGQLFALLFLLPAAQEEKNMICFTSQLFGQPHGVIFPLRKEKRGSALRDQPDGVGNDLVCPRLIPDDAGIDILDHFGGWRSCSGKARDHIVGKHTLFRLTFCVHQIPYRAALHENNGLVTILPDGRGRQAVNILRLYFPQDLLECKRHHMVTLIAQNHTIWCSRSASAAGTCSGLSAPLKETSIMRPA